MSLFPPKDGLKCPIYYLLACVESMHSFLDSCSSEKHFQPQKVEIRFAQVANYCLASVETVTCVSY